jgi:hypothetical protein
MHDYLFWFVGDANLDQQLMIARRRFEERTGRKATRVLSPVPILGTSGLTCVEDKRVLPNHLLIGGDE